MNTIQNILSMIRIVTGMVFVAMAGLLALVATGIGRAGWMLAGDRPAHRYMPESDSAGVAAMPAL